MASKPSDTVRVNLAPSPGYCVKSTALSSVVARLATPTPSHPPDAPSSSASPSALPGTLLIPNGIKVFVNIAWDANVPPPPDASEDTIQRAIRGREGHSESTKDPKDIAFRDVMKDDGKPEQEEEWSVPVVVSEPRQDIDKAGNPSIVFDCVYNVSLKTRALKNAQFRAFINELSLQRIEAQTTASSIPSPTSPNGLVLSRELKIPNIASKGKLQKRSVLVPRKLLATESEKLVQEVQPSQKKDADKPKKGILKTSKVQEIAEPTIKIGAKKPTHKWTEESNKRCLVLDVPDLTRTIHASSVLDVEPRRIIFDAPPVYSFDISVDNATASMNKRLKDEFDVDAAKAEWRVKEGRLLVYV